MRNIPVWDDALWTRLPALHEDISADCCVIGLGGSGLTAIEELLNRGLCVVGVDAVDVGAGAAGRNGGFLLSGAYDFYHDAVRLHGREQAHAIYQATISEIERIVQAAPDTVRRTGSRRLAATEWEVRDCRVQMEAMCADGLTCEWYEGDDGIGLTIPVDASFQPLARCRVLARRAISRGAALFSGTPVIGITPLRPGDPHGVRVNTPLGTVHATTVIVAVDGHLDRILPELKGRVRTARLQMLATGPTVERIVPCPMYYREGYEYWQQTEDGRIALGGFRDKAGPAEWSHDAVPTAVVQQLLESFLRQTLHVSAPIEYRWAACAGYSDNGLPIAEQVREGVFAIGAYSGTGNVIGALCARAIVAMAIDENPEPVRALVGPSRAMPARDV